MKYAIILKTRSGNSYLLGFTNTEINETNNKEDIKYTVKLRELNSLFITLEGDAKMYLS
jgi:hypothetical protein